MFLISVSIFYCQNITFTIIKIVISYFVISSVFALILEILCTTFLQGGLPLDYPTPSPHFTVQLIYLIFLIMFNFINHVLLILLLYIKRIRMWLLTAFIYSKIASAFTDSR